MNWLEKRGIAAAARRLNLEPAQIREFDVGGTRFAILPSPPFPFPLPASGGRASRSINLFLTAEGLWVEWQNRSELYQWESLLSLKAESEDGQVWLKWRLWDDREGQVSLLRGTRRFAAEAEGAFGAYVASLPIELQERINAENVTRDRTQRVHRSRSEILRRRQGLEQLAFDRAFEGVATLTDGNTSAVNAGGVELKRDAIDVLAQGFRAVVGYEAVTGHRIEDGTLFIAFSDPKLAKLQVRAAGRFGVDEFQRDLSDLVAAGA